MVFIVGITITIIPVGVRGALILVPVGNTEQTAPLHASKNRIFMPARLRERPNLSPGSPIKLTEESGEVKALLEAVASVLENKHVG